jgi:hypothetical protein
MLLVPTIFLEPGGGTKVADKERLEYWYYSIMPWYERLLHRSKVEVIKLDSRENVG